MENQPTENVINKLSIRHGLLIAIVSVVLSVVMYILNPLLQFTNFWLPLVVSIIIITLLVVLSMDIRKKIGGYWSFGDAYKSLIIMSIFIVLFSNLYSFILFKFVDPGLPARAGSAMYDSMQQRLSDMGVDQAKIDESTKTFKNGEFEAKLQPTFKNEITNFGIGLLFYAVIDLIIAACVKKKAPYFIPPADERTISDPVV